MNLTLHGDFEGIVLLWHGCGSHAYVEMIILGREPFQAIPPVTSFSTYLFVFFFFDNHGSSRREPIDRGRSGVYDDINIKSYPNTGSKSKHTHKPQNPAGPNSNP